MGPDFRNTRCVVLWGLDVENSCRAICYADIQKALDGGAKLIVVDPRKTRLAEKADVWMQIRPGTDCALALGMLNVTINEGLFDETFVRKWTSGFEELKAHVQQYAPEKVAEITWVPAEKIREAARMYAQCSPACIGVGAGSLCQFVNAFQTNRAIAILVSINGNVDIPGGHVDYSLALKDKATMASQLDFAFGILGPEQLAKRLSAGRVVKHSSFLSAHPAAVWSAIDRGDPYPVKAMLGIAQNAVLSKEDSKRVRDTLMKLDFFAVIDLFMTPTAEIADIVLPAAHWSERDEVLDAYTRNYVFCHRKIVEAPDECREDKELLIELARKLGLEGYFQSIEESLDNRLQRLEMTFEELRKTGLVEKPVSYKKYEKFKGFKTGTGKIELYSELLGQIGSDPLPVFVEPPESPVSTPELAKKYPLVLITGIKNQAYFHSGYRNVPNLRKLLPEPLLEIHPTAAKERGLRDGDWVEISSPRGSVKHKAKISDRIDPRVVAAPHGWWYGYENGWREVNINVLTSGEYYDPDVGSSVFKGLLCQVRKADSPPVEIHELKD